MDSKHSFSMFTIIWFFVKLLWHLIVLPIELLFWCMYFLKQIFFKVFDLGKAVHSVKDGVLRCPRGHEVPTSGGVYECTECGWVSESPMYACANPECQATTPYINCPTCGLSVRTPLRIGRP